MLWYLGCVYIYTCVHGCVYMCMYAPVETKSWHRVSSLVASHLIFWSRLSHWPRSSDCCECLANEPQGSSCLSSPALGLQVNTAVPGFLHGFWGSKFIPHWAISLPWMLRRFIGYKICLQFEDKCVPGTYPQSSVTGCASQCVLTLWLIISFPKEKPHGVLFVHINSKETCSFYFIMNWKREDLPRGNQ